MSRLISRGSSIHSAADGDRPSVRASVSVRLASASLSRSRRSRLGPSIVVAAPPGLLRASVTSIPISPQDLEDGSTNRSPDNRPNRSLYSYAPRTVDVKGGERIFLGDQPDRARGTSSSRGYGVIGIPRDRR